MIRALIILSAIAVLELISPAASYSQDADISFSGNEFQRLFNSLPSRLANGSSIMIGNQADQPLILVNRDTLLEQIFSKKYIVFRVFNHSENSSSIRIDFYTGSRDPAGKNISSDIFTRIGILPGLETYLVFPLSYLDAQNIFLPKYPRQLKGVVFGKRTLPEDISAFRISTSPENSRIEIREVKLTDSEPDFSLLEPAVLVDRYGQWNHKNWKGKILNDDGLEELQAELQKSAQMEIDRNKDISLYGGWLKLKFDSTGFFHTHFDGTRWWFVDPQGYAFLSFGMDCVLPRAEGVLEGNEDLFEYIPDEADSFKQAFSNVRDLKMIDFFRINLIRTFGKDYYNDWTRLTANRLREAGFNTIGNWSDRQLPRNAGIPYVIQLGGFPVTEVTLYRDFPDVFSPEYRMKAKEFASQLEKYKNDRFLLGYFLRNEPQWAFSKLEPAFEMFGKPENSFTRIRFVRWLEEKYKIIQNLNTYWGTDFRKFDDFSVVVFKDYPSDTARSDFRTFSKLMINEYIQVICSETRKADPDHLNLGMRYSHVASDLLLEASEYFDVYSLNGYSSPEPPETGIILEKTGKPVLIGEFHFGATDYGLPSTGLKSVKNQKHRAIAYSYYVENGFSRPEVIGIHYFQWMDQPLLGRFDGENYNIGFNDLLYQPYEILYKYALKSHINSYGVAAGTLKPASKKPKERPVIAF